jgi:hypothetical protein
LESIQRQARIHGQISVKRCAFCVTFGKVAGVEQFSGRANAWGAGEILDFAGTARLNEVQHPDSQTLGHRKNKNRKSTQKRKA